MGSLVQMHKVLIMVLLLAAFALPDQAMAQDLEPRRWGHLPSGMTIVGAGYAYTDSFVYFSPFWKITDTSAEINSLGVSALYTFNMAGKSARVSFLLPYLSGRWEGNVDNEYETVNLHGFSDPRLRLSVNLYGAPALKGTEYTRYRAQHPNNTVVGASLAVSAPLGQYDEEELVNLGANRWAVRPQIGMVHSRGPWSFELTGSVFFFTDNNSFLDDAVLEQENLYTVQAHAIYNFKPGFWVSVSTGYGAGGRISVDEQQTRFEVDNWVYAASFALPLGKSQSLKLTWLSGRTQNLVGRDSDNLLLGWSVRWIN